MEEGKTQRDKLHPSPERGKRLVQVAALPKTLERMERINCLYGIPD